MDVRRTGVFLLKVTRRGLSPCWWPLVCFLSFVIRLTRKACFMGRFCLLFGVLIILAGCSVQAGPEGPPGPQGEPGPPGEAAPSLADMVEDMRPSVVCIEIRDDQGWFQCSTGFYIDNEGSILTAAHAITSIQNIAEVVVTDAQGQRTPYRMGQALSNLDALVLQPVSPLSGKTPFLTPTSSAARPGEMVALLGYPRNGGIADAILVTSGILSGSYRWGGYSDGAPYHFLDAFATSGSSGSPVFTQEGELIGMVTDSGFLVEQFGDIDSFSYAIDLTGRSF